jgi:hydrogenase large subunit
MAVYEIDPVSRIEGHLGIKVTTNGSGEVTEANAHGNLWRGFENFLVGRRVNDAITFTQRICGVCPVPHGTASTLAADSVMGISDGYATFDNSNGIGIPAAGLLVRNLVLASEFLMSSITHFYHLVAQDYVQGPAMAPWLPYFATSQYSPLLLSAGHAGSSDGLPQFDFDTDGTTVLGAKNLWSAVITQYVKALRIRRLTFEAGAMFAGRMPMMSMSIVGGTTNNFRAIDEFHAKCTAYYNIMAEVAEFVISEYIPLAFALGALYKDYDNGGNGGSGWGAGVGNFLAWGAFPAIGDDGTLAIKGGWRLQDGQINSASSGALLTGRSDVTTAKAAVVANLLEYIPRSRYADSTGDFVQVNGKPNHQYPAKVTRTEPDRLREDTDGTGAYSWLKAPRWGGFPMEVGPLARMVVNDMYLTSGSLFDSAAKAITNSSALPSDATWPQAYGWLYLGKSSGLNTNIIDASLVHALGKENIGGTAGDGVAVVTGWLAGLQGGLSTMDRIRARAIESFHMVRLIMGLPTTKDAVAFAAVDAAAGKGLIHQLYRQHGLTTSDLPAFSVDTAPPAGIVSGFGLTEAPRGALGHFVTADNGTITSYQCVVPTTWNASPKDGPDGIDAEGVYHPTAGLAEFPANTGTTKRGPMEQSVCGVTFNTAARVTVSNGDPASSGVITSALSGVEVLRIAHTFDPCIACAVH